MAGSFRYKLLRSQRAPTCCFITHINNKRKGRTSCNLSSAIYQQPPKNVEVYLAFLFEKENIQNILKVVDDYWLNIIMIIMMIEDVGK